MYKLVNTSLVELRVIDLNNQLRVIPKLTFVPLPATSREKTKLIMVVVESKMRFYRIRYETYNIELVCDMQLEISILDIRALADHCYLLITKQNCIRLMMLNHLNLKATFFKSYDLPELINYKVLSVANSNFPLYDSTFINCKMIRSQQYGAYRDAIEFLPSQSRILDHVRRPSDEVQPCGLRAGLA